MGYRALFDQRSRAAACWQGARVASELNPTLSAASLICAPSGPGEGAAAHSLVVMSCQLSRGFEYG